MISIRAWRVWSCQSIFKIWLGERFNQSVENILPPYLQTLKFGYAFDQSLTYVMWPNSLQDLTFGDSFDQSLRDVKLPNSLQNLTFGDRFNQILDVGLPTGLRSLTFGKAFCRKLKDVTLPESLQRLVLHNPLRVLTPSIVKQCRPQTLVVNGLLVSCRWCTWPDRMQRMSKNKTVCAMQHQKRLSDHDIRLYYTI